MASELLTGISSDEVQRAHYRSRRLYERDREHERTVILDEGVLKGKFEVARNLLRMNMPIDKISQATGMLRAEIENLSRQ